MSMRFCILGTGSSGNSALLETPDTRILIDAGFSARKTAQLLATVGVTLDQIDAIFLTHEHADHAAALTGLARHPRIKIFANAPTARVLQAPLKHRLDWQLFETGTRFRFRDLEVQTFSVPHDAQEPVGYLFATGHTTPDAPRHRLAWLTDLGYAPQHIHEHIREADILVVEANHCPELLKADNKRPWSVKQRIGGRHGHLSNHGTRDLLATVTNPRWRHIYLTHLSRDCNTPDAVRHALAPALPALTALGCACSIVSPDETTPFLSLA